MSILTCSDIQEFVYEYMYRDKERGGKKEREGRWGGGKSAREREDERKGEGGREGGREEETSQNNIQVTRIFILKILIWIFICPIQDLHFSTPQFNI